MPRYPNNLRSALGNTPARYARSATRAAAIARSVPIGVALPRIPRIPPPHPALLVGVGIAVAVGYAYRYFSEPAEDKPQDGWTSIDHRFWSVPGSVDMNNLPYPDEPYRRGGPTLRGVLHKKRDRHYHWYGEHVPRRRWYFSQTYGPNIDPVPRVTYMPQIMPEDRTAPPPVIPDTSAVSDVVIYPYPIPRYRLVVRPGTVTSVVTTPTDVVTVHPMTPGPELKAHTSRAVAGLVTTFFGAGGEVIDFTRCFIFGMGFTYTNRHGVEKAIPRAQWTEYLYREYLLNNPRYIKGGIDRRVSERAEKLHRRYTDRYTPAEKARRFTQCLLQNQIEDAMIGLSSRAKRDIAEQLHMNAGMLGIDSQLRLLDFNVPIEDRLAYAGLI